MEIKKAPPPVSEINVTPMVDVMLVVLIIFMVITPHAQQERQYRHGDRRATRSSWRMPIRKMPSSSPLPATGRSF